MKAAAEKRPAGTGPRDAGVTWLRLAMRGAWFYRRTHVAILAGVCLSSAVLVGALLMGDSVRFSLRRFALQRLGAAEFAVATGNNFFTSALGSRVAEKSGARVGVAVLLDGMLEREGSPSERRQLNRVQVIGADVGFWQFSAKVAAAPGPEEVAVSRNVADRLGVQPGDTITVSVAAPSKLPRQAPLAARDDRLMRRGVLTVCCVVSDDQFGRFSLRANQLASYNVFVHPQWLRQKTGLGDQSNLMLIGRGEEPLSADRVSDALAVSWRLEDAGLRVDDQRGNSLVTDRIFISDEVSTAVMDATQPSAGVSAYLLKSISLKKEGVLRTVPYSFVLAATPSARAGLSPVPAGLANDEAVIHQWLADELAAEEGDVISVSVDRLDASGSFVAGTHSFRVAAIVPTEELQAARQFVPAFPGLSDVDRCRDWDVGMPMDEALLRDDRNEAYWEQYRDTPRMLVTLAAGRAMWSNPLGYVTSVHSAVPDMVELKALARESLTPEMVGLAVVPVREQALAAVEQGMDFGELFVSMSGFLIIAVLVLTALLFAFAVDQRLAEFGMLMATGFRGRHVLRLLLLEVGLIAVVGCVAGAFLGSLYTRALVWAVGTHWQAVTAGAPIQFHATAARMITGGVSALACALFTLWLAVRHTARRDAHALLIGDGAQEESAGGRTRVMLYWFVVVLAVATALGMVVHSVATDSRHATNVFFGAGSLLLLAGTGTCRQILIRLRGRTMVRAARQVRLSLGQLSVRSAARRLRPSLVVCGLVAAALFLVLSVSAMRQDLRRHAGERWSATGGFELICETTVPLPDDLSGERGRQRYGLDRDARLEGVSFVSCKVRGGDDASCLNLNRAREPRLIGVDVDALRELGAFVPPGTSESVWQMLSKEPGEGVLPALAGDGNTAMWGLELAVGPEKGGEIVYKTDRGTAVTVKLVGALPQSLGLFQGNVLMSLSDLNTFFPGVEGYSLFLVDVPPGRSVAEVQTALNERLAQVGGDTQSTVERVAQFYAVEKTYLSVFLVLGGLALLLGVAGLGIVVMRHILERRSELAMLMCVGFTRRNVQWMIAGEHLLLLFMGVAVGTVSAGVAVWPSVAAVGGEVPWGVLCALVVGVFSIGAVSILAATHFALRGELLVALRNE